MWRFFNKANLNPAAPKTRISVNDTEDQQRERRKFCIHTLNNRSISTNIKFHHFVNGTQIEFSSISKKTF